MRRHLVLAIALPLMLSAHACQKEKHVGAAQDEASAVSPVTQLPGLSSHLALDKMTSLSLFPELLPEYVSTDLATGARMDRRLYSVNFLSTATVGEINGMLASVGASIIAMDPGVGILDIMVLDPGDWDAAIAIEEQLDALPFTRHATAGYLLKDN